MMKNIHRFIGEWGNSMKWEGGRSRSYDGENVSGVIETWLIGKNEDAQNFAMRFYSVESDGNTVEEQHDHDHGILVLFGKAKVFMGEHWHDLDQGDVVYIPPMVRHQVLNRGNEQMGFICVIPARRKKKNKIVWADEEIKFDQD
jgi:quercetin dioxygenase-like cupin family protein